MIPSGKIMKVKVSSILGITAPFPQGGSIRLTIPKRMVKKFNIRRKISREEYYGLIFLETDKGVLLVPIDQRLNAITISNALSFVDLSHLSKEDLEILFQEEEDLEEE